MCFSKLVRDSLNVSSKLSKTEGYMPPWDCWSLSMTFITGEFTLESRRGIPYFSLAEVTLRKNSHIHRKIGKMKRQRDGYQMKEQDKTPEKQLNEVEIGNLSEKEFRIMLVNMIQDLRKRMEAKIEKMQEMFNKDLEELKNKQR